MFEIAPVGIATIDFEGRRYLTANESFQRMAGYTEAELRNLMPASGDAMAEARRAGLTGKTRRPQ
jgi:PAS domain S-box-containing protein